MKKIYLLLSIAVIFLTGCGKTTYEEIDYNKFHEMINNEKDFILFIGSNECSHCDNYKLTINEIVKNYSIDIYYIDISKLSDNEYKYLNGVSNFGGSTPTTIFIKDGKEYCGENNICPYYRIVGAQSYDKVLKKLVEKGYIK